MLLATAVLSLSCQLESQYFSQLTGGARVSKFHYKLKVDDAANDEGKIVFGNSVTECEDISRLSFEPADFERLQQDPNAVVNATVEINDPSLEMKAQLNCKRIK